MENWTTNHILFIHSGYTFCSFVYQLYFQCNTLRFVSYNVFHELKYFIIITCYYAYNGNWYINFFNAVFSEKFLLCCKSSRAGKGGIDLFVFILIASLLLLANLSWKPTTMQLNCSFILIMQNMRRLISARLHIN